MSSPLLNRIRAYLEAHGPQLEEDLLEALDVRSHSLTRLLGASQSPLKQQGDYIFLADQAAQVASLEPLPDRLVDEYVIFDLETTTKDPKVADILEVAALHIRRGKVVGQFQSLISGTAPTPEISVLTGLTEEELQKSGRPLAAVMQDFHAFIGALPLAGHNIAAYDIPVMTRAFKSLGLRFTAPILLDTMLLAPLAFGREDPPVETYSLEGLHRRFIGGVHENAHRALDDCQATWRLIRVMSGRLNALPVDTKALLATLPVAELALALTPASVSEKRFKALGEQVLGQLARVSHVRSSGRPVGSLEEVFPHPRPGQLEMAGSVAETLQVGGRLVVEAPTGTGKTRAYLYPALQQAGKGKPVVISTHTRQLQAQIVQEAQALADQGYGIRVAALKGQGNYLCPERLALLLERRFDAASGRVDMPPGEARAAALLLMQASHGDFGLIPGSPVTRLPEFGRIRAMTATVARRCRAACPFSDFCGYERTRTLVDDAQVVVVNHALLLRNQFGHLESEDFPFERVIIDEAHDLEDVATAALRQEVSTDGLLGVAREFLRQFSKGQQGMLGTLEQSRDEDLAKLVRNAMAGFERLVQEIGEWQAAVRGYAMQYGTGGEDFGYQAPVEPYHLQTSEWRAAARMLDGLIRSLRYCVRFLPELAIKAPESKLDLDTLQERMNSQIELMELLRDRSLEKPHVYAVTADDTSATFWGAPLWVSMLLGGIWQKTKSLILTSATLRVPGTGHAEGDGDTEDFRIFAASLGLPPSRYQVLAPVLPYEQGHVLLAGHLPMVRHPDFGHMVGSELDNLLPQLPHQSLHIFTANERLRTAARQLTTSHWQTLRDGGERVVRELQQAQAGHALASAGFMQGVDLRHLSVVSLDKTPFPVPDLVMDARRRDLGDFETYWEELYLPKAVLRFVQSFGRLIRDERAATGPGVFALLDKRLGYAHYQHRFLSALPIPPQNIHRAAQQSEFYETLGRLLGLHLTYQELTAPKLQLIEELRTRLLGLPEDRRAELLLEAMRRLFEIAEPAFRPGQREGMLACLDRQDLLCVMPTGSGKSIVFQLPALLGERYTVVISPLVALIQDQVLRLQQLGLPAAGLWGGLSKAEQNAVITDTREGRVKLLYLAPERLRKSPELRRLLAGTPPERIVYDEAHCLLEWGHDFRPDYLHTQRELGALGVQARTSAFTATATRHVRGQLLARLNMTAARRVELGVQRSNLRYQIWNVQRHKSEAGRARRVSRDEALLTMLVGLRENPDTMDGRAIVYVGSRKKAERLTALISETGLSAAAYHAGLSPAVRAELLEQFQDRTIRIMVATNAFGMGVDAPDIHLVVHYDAPLSLEAYVQEAGRAGRDPRIQAYAVLLWHAGSDKRASWMINHSYPDATQAQQLLHAIGVKDAYPTVSELGSLEQVDLGTLPSLLHLLEEAGCLEYEYVPGFYRIYPYYGVPLPEDPAVRELVAESAGAPVHLSRRFGNRAQEMADKLHGYQQDGQLGVTAVEPALRINVREANIGRTRYRALVDGLKRHKQERYEDLKRYILSADICRGASLQLYFTGRSDVCGNCDICRPAARLPWEGTQVDLTELWNPHRELLRLFRYYAKHNFTPGPGSAIRVLRGADGTANETGFRAFQAVEKAAPNFGKLRFLNQQQIGKAMEDLIRRGQLLEHQRVYANGQALPAISITERGKEEAAKWIRES